MESNNNNNSRRGAVSSSAFLLIITIAVLVFVGAFMYRFLFMRESTYVPEYDPMISRIINQIEEQEKNQDCAKRSITYLDASISQISGSIDSVNGTRKAGFENSIKQKLGYFSRDGYYDSDELLEEVYNENFGTTSYGSNILYLVYNKNEDECNYKEELDQIVNESRDLFVRRLRTSEIFKLLVPSGDSTKAQTSDIDKFIVDVLKETRNIQRQIKSKAERIKSEKSDEISFTEEEITSTQKSLAKYHKNTSNKSLMDSSLPYFGAITIIIFPISIIILFFLLQRYSNGKENYSDKLISSVFNVNFLIKLTTLFLLVITILILGLSEKVNGEVLGTLLGGISVYILQRSATINNSSPNQGKNNSQDTKQP